MGRSYIRNVGTGSIYNESGEIMAGQIVFCAGNSIPNGYLECNGATVSRTTYATLFAAIGSTYGAGDGATTFALPDLRGEFLRGADRGRGVDSGRAVGSAQSDQNKVHNHKRDPVNGGFNRNDTGGSYSLAGQAFGIYGKGFASGTLSTPHSDMIDGGFTENSGGNENRPRNVAMIAAIKYS